VTYALAFSFIFVMGNLTTPIASLIILLSPMTAKDWEIVGPTYVVLVVLVAGSSSIYRHDVMFVAYNI
jgi:hypothetical protein